MQTQHKDSVGTQSSGVSSMSPGGKKRRWLVTLGTLVVVVLLVGASALVFAQLAARQKNLSASLPPAGQWKQVLAGYTAVSIVVAQSDPATLYACATKSNVVSNQQPPVGFTLLRSKDFGDHWQDIGAGAALGFTCNIAVNPANADDFYAVSVSNSPQRPALLKHSTDGGQTWQTIQPALMLPNGQAARWQVGQISSAGNRLFAIQVSTVSAPVGVASSPSPQTLLRSLSSRLVSSTDGGHTWSILDKRSQTVALSVRSYAVDPADANTIYEVLGSVTLPIEPVPATPQGSGIMPGPVYGLNDQLYKTTDGGASWSLLLKNLPYGTQVRLASGKPQVVYVGGFMGPVPLAAAAPSSPASPPSGIEAGFHMQVSADGGASWKNVSTPSDAQRIVSWFVSADGLLYSAPYVANSGSGGGTGGTGVPGTVVPTTPIAPPPVTPGGGQHYSGPPTKDGTPVGAIAVAPGASPATSTPFIQRYDPATQQWSNVVLPPAPGMLLTLTSTTSGGGAILWFLGQTGSQYSVYRYIV